MNTQNTTPPPLPRKRPALVWVISIFYIVSAGFTLLSFALIFSESIPLNEAQRAYFQSQTPFDYGSSFLIGLGNLTGAVLLFLLRRHAFHCFAGAFALGILLLGYQILAKNWLGAIGGPGLVGALIGWGIAVAIIVYTRKLITQGLLK
jgi:hypothetical protein